MDAETAAKRLHLVTEAILTQLEMLESFIDVSSTCDMDGVHNASAQYFLLLELLLVMNGSTHFEAGVRVNQARIEVDLRFAGQPVVSTATSKEVSTNMRVKTILKRKAVRELVLSPLEELALLDG